VDYEKLSDDRFGESSASVQARVESAREVQHWRFNSGNLPQFDNASKVVSHSDMHPAEVHQYGPSDTTTQSLMCSAMSQTQLSGHAYHRVLKVSRTIADLAGKSYIASQNLAEALQYRPKLGQY
jgi:magnesium chelatase family protein